VSVRKIVFNPRRKDEMTNKSEVKSAFATAVRSRRNRLGLSQEQLAERAALHRTYISDIERAARNLSLESISKLADALEVSVATLFLPETPAGELHQHNGSRQFVDILLVEDDANDVELTLQAFKKSRFANRVQIVRDGAEALDYVFCRGLHAGRKQEDHPQIILLDLNLPKIGGLEVLRRIKADEKARHIPVVVLTGSQNDLDISESRRLGAVTYILKPVDFHRLSQVTPQLSLNWALLKPNEARA
jgi:CheY-like chemotaxis protein